MSCKECPICLTLKGLVDAMTWGYEQKRIHYGRYGMPAPPPPEWLANAAQTIAEHEGIQK